MGNSNLNLNDRLLVSGNFAVDGNLIDCYLKNRTIAVKIANRMDNPKLDQGYV